MRGCDEAELFLPSGVLVVGTDLAIDLATLGLRTLGAAISKTVNIRIEDLHENSCRYQEINACYPYDADDMIKREPNCPELCRKSPRYFEVICWVERDLRATAS